jgi:hypothetical protein
MPISRGLASGLAVAALLVAAAAPAQEMSAETWEELRGLQSQVVEGRDAIVEANLDLTEAEAEAFWPVYEDYREAASAVRERLAKLVEAYAANVDVMTDSKAEAFFEEWLAIDRQELEMRETYAKRIRDVLPARKAVRFFQVENKLDAILRLDSAMRIPLVE